MMKKSTFLHLLLLVAALMISISGNKANAQTPYGTQFENMKFDDWANWSSNNNSIEPLQWHATKSGSNGGGIINYVTLAPQVVHRSTERRPGSESGSCAELRMESTLGIKANGSLTNGRMYLGNTTPGHTNNYMFTSRGTSGGVFDTPLQNGVPDSIAVWVCFRSTSTTERAFIHTAIHGDNDFRLISLGTYNPISMLVAKGDLTFTRQCNTTGDMVWERMSVPFIVDGDCQSTDAKYILAIFTTNVTAGAGQTGDKLFVDDVLLIYNPTLTTSAIATTTYTRTGSGSLPISVPYTLVGSMSPYNLNADANEVIAELSDASGSFANPIELGRVTSDVSGTISGNIPASVADGTGYKVRVRSTNYPMTAAASVTTLTINTQQFTVAVSASPAAGGTVSGGGTFNVGTPVTVTATANTGYAFVNWTENGNVVSLNSSYNFTLTDNITLVANFVPTYNITVSANPTAGGTVSIDGGGTNVPQGTEKIVRAVTNPGYVFQNWTENGTEVSNKLNYSFTVTAHRNLVANFSQINYYTVELSSNPVGAGTLSQSGSGSYTNGTHVTVTAITNSGYQFVNWTENGTEVSATPSFNFQISASRTFVANFIQLCTVNISATPSAGGTVSGAGITGGIGIFISGTEVSVNAVANTGYVFSKWTENSVEVSTNANYVFNVASNRTLVANFLPRYTLSLTANPTNGGMVSGEGTYTQGAQVTATATPYEGYRFVNWKNQGGTTVSTSAEYTFSIAGNTTLTANFELIPMFNINAIAVPSAGGTITGAGQYQQGTSVTLTATANQGYEFVNWTEGGNPLSTNPTYSLTATANRTLQANFNATSTGYIISLAASPAQGGTVSGGGIYEDGENCTVVATPSAGYEFVNWTENGSVVGTVPTYAFVVNNDRDLVANFSLIDFDIVLVASPTNGGTLTGAGSFVLGTPITVTATPNSNFNFVNWTEGTNIVANTQSFNFTVNRDRTLTANFREFFTVQTSASPAQGGTVSGGDGTYYFGSNVTVMATPNTGYVFVNWTENGSEVSTSYLYSFEIAGNRNLVANFRQNVEYTVSLTANPTNGGSVTGAGTYIDGTQVTILATQNTGYKFVSWTENGNVVSTTSGYTFNISGNRNLVANFEEYFEIILSANPPEAGAVSGTGSFTYNMETTVYAMTNEGYRFLNWTENGSIVSTEIEYTFVVEGSRNLVANFETIQYCTMTVIVDADKGEVFGAGEYEVGAEVTLTAVPKTDYAFVGWYKNGIEISNEPVLMFIAEGDVVLNALFDIASIKDYIIENLDIYPNPANDYFVISAPFDIDAMEIFNTSGKLVRKINVNANTTTINTSDLSSGTYILRFKVEANMVTKRIVITK